MITATRRAAATALVFTPLLAGLVGASAGTLYKHPSPVRNSPEVVCPAAPATVPLPRWEPGRPVRPDLAVSWLLGEVHPPGPSGRALS